MTAASPATSKTELAFVGLGSNLDEPAQQVQRAMDELAALPQTRLRKRSSLYRSAPVGELEQPDFVNAVVALDTALPAPALLEALLAIEAAHGRERKAPNAARTLDLDLLLYGRRVICTPALRVPHPRMHERAFVLVPLHEVDADLDIPGAGPVRALLDSVRGQRVERLDG